MNKQENYLLKCIVNNEHQLGPFCGMVTNIYYQMIAENNVQSIDSIIETGIKIRMKAIEMANQQELGLPKLGE